MECPNCRAENLEGKKFCGDCGVELPQPLPPEPVEPSQAVYAQPRQSWMRSNWKGLVSLVVVMIVALSVMGLVYTQPWSKVKVLVAHGEHSTIGVKVYIDGVLKASVGVSPGGWSIVGTWSVTAGSHTVAVDAGAWYYDPGGWFTDPYWYYEEPDGTSDFVYTYEVGPLFTKNAYIQL